MEAFAVELSYRQELRHRSFRCQPSITLPTRVWIAVPDVAGNGETYCDVHYIHACEEKKFEIEMDKHRLIEGLFFNGARFYEVNIARKCCESSKILMEFHDGKRKIETPRQWKIEESNPNCKLFFDDSEEPIAVNRHFLSRRSLVFKCMFEGEFKEKDAEEVKIRKMKKEDFNKFLLCLYNPTVSLLDAEDLEIVMTIGDLYDCEEVMKSCEESIMKKELISLGDYKAFLKLANRYNLKTFVKKAVEDAPTNFLAGLVDRDFWQEIDGETKRIIRDRNSQIW